MSPVEYKKMPLPPPLLSPPTLAWDPVEPPSEFGVWQIRSHLRSVEGRQTKVMLPIKAKTLVKTGLKVKLTSGRAIVVTAPDLVQRDLWMPSPLIIPSSGLWTSLDLWIFNGGFSTAWMTDDTLLAYLLVMA